MKPRTPGLRAARAPAAFAATEAADQRSVLARVIDRELAWYFSYAETALRLGTVAFLPSHEPHCDSEETALRRGMELATRVRIAIYAMPTHLAGVLRAVHTPRRWPVSVQRAFRELSGVAVRLTCAVHPWPARNGHDGLEQAAAQHLARLMATDAARPLALRKKARRMVDSAADAYVRARRKVEERAIAVGRRTAKEVVGS